MIHGRHPRRRDRQQQQSRPLPFHSRNYRGGRSVPSAGRSWHLRPRFPLSPCRPDESTAVTTIATAGRSSLLIANEGGGDDPQLISLQGRPELRGGQKSSAEKPGPLAETIRRVFRPRGADHSPWL